MSKKMTEAERKRRRRNIALLLLILGVAALFYVMSIVRLSLGEAGG
jgi:predicted nucleic acid-binding Zn ribbon protein